MTCCGSWDAAAWGWSIRPGTATPGDLVALKVLRPDTLDVARFRVEAQVLARVEHEYVVPLYEVGEHEGVRYFTMRFIEGGDLAGRIGEYAIPSTATRPEADEVGRQIAALMAKVARAVGHVHRCGVLHRDLKPGNILIGDDGRPLVSDFGLSRRFAADELASALTDTASVDPVSLPGQAVGTRGYRAPEQAEGVYVLTTAADIFSLGAILYRLLAGTVPFEDGTTAGLAALLDPDREATSPSASNPALAPGSDLEWVCLKCLAKDPAARYETANALADDLARVRRGRAGQPARPGVAGPGPAGPRAAQRRLGRPDLGPGRVDRGGPELRPARRPLRADPRRLDGRRLLGVVPGVRGADLVGLPGPAVPAASHGGLERDLLVLWVGISLAGLTLFALYCPPLGTAGAAGLLRFYPPWAAVTGLGLFLAGRIHWGGLYLLGIGFFLLALLMPLAIEFAPLAYGAFLGPWPRLDGSSPRLVGRRRPPRPVRDERRSTITSVTSWPFLMTAQERLEGDCAHAATAAPRER